MAGASGPRATVFRMSTARHELSVQVADPSYGPFMEPSEAERPVVRTGIESVPWEPLRPADIAPAGELVFVDGTQQIEAWLTASHANVPMPIAAVAFAVGAGAVLAGPGRPAELVELELRRTVIAEGDHMLRLPAIGGFHWESQGGSAREPSGLARRVGQMRQQLEHQIAERLARPDRLIVLDGRLSFVRDAPGPIVGAVKSHHQMYLDGDEAAVITALAVGERTPLFSIGRDRFSWYQRLPGVGEQGWAGILRGEVAQTVGSRAAQQLADRATRELPRFAGRPHRDPRAPQNMQPVGVLENRLRHRMGDRRLALRAVRRAATHAVLETAALATADESRPAMVAA